MSGDGFRLRPADVGGYRGWYAVTGDGPPAVLLASPLALAVSYRDTAFYLGRGHRVYTVAMPGSGRGSSVPTGWGIEEYAGWAAGLLDALGLERVTLIGHSHAGAVATALAALHPRRIGRLVLADSSGAIPDTLGRAFLGRVADVFVAELGLAVRAWHHLAFNAVFQTRNFVRQTRVALAADVTGYADRVAVPTLLAWGARDHTTPPCCIDVLARHVRDVTVYVSPRGSHDWVVDRPAEFAAAVGRFAGAAGRAVTVEEYADA